MKLVSFSSAVREGKSNWFIDTFTQAPRTLRSAEYHTGLVPAALESLFLSQKYPFPSEFWLALEGDNVLGRVGASVPMSYPELGYFGFFEVQTKADGQHITEALLQEASQWLKDKGSKKIVGPVNFNTWFPYRFRVNETDNARFMWEPVNPPEYPKYFAMLGFEINQTYHTLGLDGLDHLVEAIKPAYERAEAQGFGFEVLDPKSLMEKTVPILHQISLEAFRKNHLYEPIDLKSFQMLYAPLAQKPDLAMARLILSPEPHREPLGFFFCFQDGEYAVLKSAGIVDRARGLGLSNAALYLNMKEAQSRGLKKVITALMKTGAQSESYSKKMQTLWQHEYVLYIK